MDQSKKEASPSESKSDKPWAKLSQLLFMPATSFPSYWKDHFKGTFLENTNPYERNDYLTKDGGRVHYFPSLLEGKSVVVFCPIEGSMNTFKSMQWELVDTEIYGVQELAETKAILSQKPEGYDETLRDQLAKDLSIDKNEHIYIGMSCGGALATSFARRTPCDELITFGALRAGNQAFFDEVTEKVHNIRCYVNPGDPFAHIPIKAGQFARTIDPQDCKDHKEGHRLITCHGHYLGVDFAKESLETRCQRGLDYFFKK